MDWFAVGKRCRLLETNALPKWESKYRQTHSVKETHLVKENVYGCPVPCLYNKQPE